MEKPLPTSFHKVRDILTKEYTTSDDDTVRAGLDNIRLSVMVAVPSKDVDEEEAPLEAIRKVNTMIKCLVNKLPSIKLGLWKPDNQIKKLISDRVT